MRNECAEHKMPRDRRRRETVAEFQNNEHISIKFSSFGCAEKSEKKKSKNVNFSVFFHLR